MAMMAIKRDNCKDCISACEHAGKDREFVCLGEASCKRSSAAAWDDTKITNGRVCTSCGAGVFKDIFFRGGQMNYCPNCGRQMRNA